MSLLYAPLIYFWCRQLGLQDSDADDVVQEVLLAVASRVGKFQRTRAEGSFRGWLRTITRNKLGDFIRAGSRRQRIIDETKLPSSFLTAAQPREEAGGEARDDETRLVFNRVLELIRTRFEDSTWRAFLRVVMDGAAPNDVADELNLSVESVYQAKSRILRVIRDELHDLGD